MSLIYRSIIGFLLATSLLLSGCLPVKDITGDGRPFSGNTDPGFQVATVTDPSKAGKNGIPDLRSKLQTFDLNWAKAGAAPSLSQPFYVFGANKEEPTVITSIRFLGPNAEDFSMVGMTLPRTLPFGEYDSFQVAFSPRRDGGNRTAIVEIQSKRGKLEVLRVQANAEPLSGEVSIWRNGYEQFNMANAGGNAVAVASGAMNSFGCRPLFDGRVEFEIRNPGEGPLVVTAGQIQDDAENAFDWETANQFPLTVAAGQTVVVTAKLKETMAPGYYHATIKFLSEDFNEPVYQVYLATYKPEPAPCLTADIHPQGTAPTFSDLQWEDLGKFAGPQAFSLTLANHGDAELVINSDEFSLQYRPLFPPEVCSPSSVVWDFQTRGSVTLEAGEELTTTLTFSGVTNCEANSPGNFPFEMYIERPDARGNSRPVVLARGEFQLGQPSTVLQAYVGPIAPLPRRSIREGEIVTLGTAPAIFDFSPATSTPIEILSVTREFQDFGLQLGATLPQMLNENDRLVVQVTQLISAPRQTPRQTKITVSYRQSGGAPVNFIFSVKR